MSSKELLLIENLTKWFPIRGGLLSKVVANVKAVNGVSLSIAEGETFGLVGESGCGKTTLGKCILRLIQPSSGKIIIEGTDVTKLKRKQFKPYRRKMQIVFQDPYASLDPRQTVKGALVEAMRASGRTTSKEEASERAKELIKRVGLNEDHLNRFPHEFSGGQRQRIAVARALATDPEFLVLDEPTSFLDVSVQAQILNLLKGLQKELGLTFLFISHNLSVVGHMSDRIGVMYLGELMEVGSKDQVYTLPKHPYTYALMNAIPVPDPRVPKHEALLKGDVPSPINPPTACVFNTRCPYAREKCFESKPPLREVGDRLVACHFAEEFDFETVLKTFK